MLFRDAQSAGPTIFWQRSKAIRNLVGLEQAGVYGSFHSDSNSSLGVNSFSWVLVGSKMTVNSRLFLVEGVHFPWKGHENDNHAEGCSAVYLYSWVSVGSKMIVHGLVSMLEENQQCRLNL